MGRGLPIVLGLMVLAGAAAARQPILVLPLVQAQCEGAVPCQPAFEFRTGTAQLTAAREPAPTCPKTGKPSETPGGAVKMTGVTQNEAPFTGTLAVECEAIHGARPPSRGRSSRGTRTRRAAGGPPGA